jgi:hypothetical protein
MFQTCRLLGVDPITYLNDVLPGIMTGQTTDLLVVTPAAYRDRFQTARSASNEHS